ncbi:unnamed protein product, partial [Mesorhabditis belari]|uniref:Uncharacterized protein n=1 Tax=Mesorhabditis belari TaxID=2138241 RepID=A0AAF3J3B8_9BILA
MARVVRSLLIAFLICWLNNNSYLAQAQDRTAEFRNNLIAEHSRKTFQDTNSEETVQTILDSIHSASSTQTIRPTPISDVLHGFTHEFVESSREHLEKETDANIFKKLWYDPAFRVHSLCEPHNSGNQNEQLVWTESGDRLLKIIGNGVVAGGYNMMMAPNQALGKRTEVYVAMYIESMSSFKAQTMDFEMDMYLAMGWFDRRLAHNCTHPILVTSKVIADRIWHPDLYFVNSKFAYLQEVTTPNFMVVVYPDGLVFKSVRVDVTLSCMLELQMFPMDFQECPILIQSYAYIENIVKLHWHIDHPHFPVGSNQDIKLNDMEIVDKKFEDCSGAYPMFRGSCQDGKCYANWSCIKASIVMKRLVLFHIIQTYIPTGMLVVISWMSFWLDPRASPARISLTITSLLTLTTMSNGARQDLPQVSYIKALDIWLTFSQGLIFLVLLEYSFVSFYITRRVFDCVHRKFQQKLSNHNHHKHSGEDYKCEEAPTPESFPFARSGRESPPPPQIIVDGVNGELNNGSVLGGSMRESLVSEKDRDAAREHEKQPFTVTHGLSQCMSRTAALVSATPHAAAHIYNKFDFTKPCTKCALENERTARKIDRYSRFVFPMVFVIFCVAYWSYYYWIKSENEAKNKN